MKTRFDNSQNWITGTGSVTNIKELETSHLMNIIKMFITKPHLIASMIIDDIENSETCSVPTVWNSYTHDCENIKKDSIFNVTSMSEKELIEYALNSVLGRSMLEELRCRGVNIENFIDMCKPRVEVVE